MFVGSELHLLAASHNAKCFGFVAGTAETKVKWLGAVALCTISG